MSRFDASLLGRAAAWLRDGPAAPAPPPAAARAGDLALEVAAALCRRFEGLRLRPYLCPAGVPTIGYGATHYEDGRRVQLKDQPITAERAEQLLLHHLRTVYLPTVLRLCPGVDTAERLAALVDFCFNLGGGNLQASTLRRRVNAQSWDEARAELLKWVLARGQVMRGLLLRRQAEAALLN